MRYFVIALLLPVVCSVITAVIMAAVLLPSGSLGYMVTKMDYGKLAATVLYVITMSIVFMLFGFGEEFGWRGYLTPKLEKLMPAPAAIIVSGIIWGLWHAPIIACGHDFGRDYAGYPWVGIGLIFIHKSFLNCSVETVRRNLLEFVEIPIKRIALLTGIFLENALPILRK